MCSVLGAVVRTARGRDLFRMALQRASARGRDSFGYHARTGDFGTLVRVPENAALSEHETPILDGGEQPNILVANCRAEPTTEWVAKKEVDDIQPFVGAGWAVAHNGTIANDKALAAEYDMLLTSAIDSAVLPLLFGHMLGDPLMQLRLGTHRIVGSYAIVASHDSAPEKLFFACNYRPLYLAKHLPTGDIFIASDPEYMTRGDGILGEWQVEAVQPYSMGFIDARTGQVYVEDHRPSLNNKALVICSGGLDSTTVASMLDVTGHAVTLLHFIYGCRASEAEHEAIHMIGKARGWPVEVIDLGVLFTQVIGGSPLTGSGKVNTDGAGEAGAEFAHEWVPARNTVMLSIASGYAEAHGFSKIALGANIEEAGAYPDNEAVFIDRFNHLLPWVVGDGKRVELAAPLMNHTKSEIAQAAIDFNAPIELTWSCYEDGERHCGKCGPCYMRRKAFEMIGRRDPVFAHLADAG